MSTWYRTRWHESYSSAVIDPVEIVKTTTAQVYIGERREAKRSEFSNYFESRDEAVEFIKNGLRAKRDFHQTQADRFAEAVERSY